MIFYSLPTVTFTLMSSELEIKDTIDSEKSVSYLDNLIEIDINGNLTTKLYNKRDDFNFPFLCSSIPSSLAFGVSVSQFIPYARTCSTYEQFIKRVILIVLSHIFLNYSMFINTS